MPEPIRLASRRSQLALAQSRMVAARITELTGRTVEILEVVSEGDRSAAPLTQIGGTGVFVAAVRQAVLDGEADIAVHSLKDLPTAPEPGIQLAAVPAREDAHDVVCAQGSVWAELPAGARVGTGSPRRVAQLAGLRSDVELVDIRGNLDSRLARVGDDLAAIVVAAAGINRLGVTDRAQPQQLSFEQMLPAPGQGALAVEARDDAEPELRLAMARLDDMATRAAVTAERELLRTLEAGCLAPVGAIAQVSGRGHDATVVLDAGIFTAKRQIRMTQTAPVDSAAALGQQLAERMLADGGADLLTETRT